MQPLNIRSAVTTLLARVRASPLRQPSPAPDSLSHPSSPASLTARRHWTLGAALIIVAVALATAVRYWLGEVFGLHETFITYEPTVILVASLLGANEGICTTILCAVAADYFFLLGPGFAIARAGDRISIVVFLCFGVALSLVIGALRTRTLQKERALDDLRTGEERFFAERRRLNEANLQLAAIVESSDDAIIGKDTHSIITSWNRGAEAVFGYTAVEMIGQSIRCLLPPGHEEEEDEMLARLLEGETVGHFDAVRVAKGGRSIHVSITVSPVKDANGSVIGASKIARDITGTRNLQKQLQQSQKMEAIGQLTGGIAHDFNNLLAIILGALELQEDAIAGNAEALQRWNVAHKAAGRGAELTRRLLAFSSVGQFNVAPTDLRHSVRNTVELAARLLGPEINTRLKLDDSMPPVLVDPAGFGSALLNLIVNARDAMPRGGDLTICARVVHLEGSVAASLNGTPTSGAYACVSVTDTGTGMPQSVIDRVFEPFFTTKSRGRGTGLGLSMVYGFVKQSNGGIRIYSEPGYGTTITFYLPFAGDPPQPMEHDPVENVAVRRSGVVLIVDDEAELVDIAVTYLSARGYTVLSARDAKEALQVIADHGAVDAMVTDIVMGGGMDGMELAQTVRLLSPSTKVVYSSGFPADALSERSLPLAGSLILQKPYRLAELGASVANALGGPA